MAAEQAKTPHTEPDYIAIFESLTEHSQNYKLLAERVLYRYDFGNDQAAYDYKPDLQDSFSRIYPQLGLHLKEKLHESINSNGVLDFVEAAKMLLRCTTVVKLYNKALAEGQKMEKFILPGVEVWYVMLPHQLQLRTVCVVSNQNPLLLLKYLGTNQSTYRLLGPKFRSLTIYGNIYTILKPTDVNAIADTLNRYGHQLSTLKLDCLDLAQLKKDETFQVFVRMKTLSVFLKDKKASNFFFTEIMNAVLWDQIECLSLKLNFPIKNANFLFDWLFRETQLLTCLRKFEIVIYYMVMVKEYDLKMLKFTLENLVKTIKGKVEVLKISVQPTVLMLDWEKMPDCSFFVDLYGGAFRDTLTKLIIKLPCLVQEDHYAFLLKLPREKYPKLETLILDYDLYATTVFAEDNVREQTETMCIQQIMFSSKLIEDNSPDSIAPGIRRLTIKGLFKIKQTILRNIARVFPNLVELNIQVRESTIYFALQDQHLLEMLVMLGQLRILRFLDSFTKPDGLYRSIEFMCNRAKSLKEPNVPMVVRIPIDLQWKENANQTVLDTISEASKWIKVV